MIRRHVAASVAIAATLLAFGANGAGERAYYTGQTVLELGGKAVGTPQSASGGGVVAQVDTAATGADKHVVNARPEELVLQVSSLMDGAFWGMIAQSLDKGDKLSGALHFGDASLKETQKLVFSEGVLTEFGIPGMDSASKELAYFTARILPGQAARTFGSGAPMPRASVATSTTKRWFVNGFKVNLPGIEPAGVVKIEPFAIRNGTLQNKSYGDSIVVPGVAIGKRTISDLVLTLREASSKGAIDWYTAMVQQGKPSERSGSIELLSATGEVLAAFDLTGVGVYRLDVEKNESPTAERRFQLFTYVETARFRPVSLAR